MDTRHRYQLKYPFKYIYFNVEHYDDQWKVFMQNKLSKIEYPKSKDQQDL